MAQWYESIIHGRGADNIGGAGSSGSSVAILTQAQYDALQPKDNDTVYFIRG